MCAAAELQMHRVFIKSLWFAGGKHTFGALAASLLVHASPLIELHGVLRYMVTCLQSNRAGDGHPLLDSPVVVFRPQAT